MPERKFFLPSLRRGFLAASVMTAMAWTLLPHAARAADAPLVAGEVVKVDRAGGRVTIKHNGIAALDMPAMALAWRVANPAWLDGLAAGDRVRFAPARIDGQYTVTALSKAAP